MKYNYPSIFFKTILPLFCTVAYLLVSCGNENTDDQLEDKIETALTGYKTIDVEVKDGIVSIGGTVNSESDKDKVEGIVQAAGMADIKSIQNNIIVVSSTEAIAKSEDIITESVDSTLTRDVNRVLESFPSITAEVKNGTIKASGNLEESRMNELKAAFDNLKPKAVDISGVTAK